MSTGENEKVPYTVANIKKCMCPKCPVQADSKCAKAVLHQLDQKIIYPHHDFKHLTEKYFEIG